MVIDLDDYVAPVDAAPMLGLRYPTLMARIDRGKIKTIQWGRFHLIHKEELEKHKEPGR